MGEDGRGKRYSEALKLKVVRELEQGRITPLQAQKEYGIGGGQTIRGWVKRYGKGKSARGRRSVSSGMDQRIERLEGQKRDLERALARASVKVAALEALMEEAEAFYGEGFKKNFGTGR